ncbi:MAG: FxLYD domain-containing protein [Candidatus Nitrosocosmicus sp.]
MTSNSLRPEIIILNISELAVQNSTTGLTSVSGTIQNNSTEDIENLKVNVTLYDSHNKTIRDMTRFVSGPFTVYEPGSTERFSFLMSVEGFDHYTTTAYAERVT